jgi:hypothetical protein
MTRTLKALGLAMASIAALVAVMAPASQAATGALTTNVFPSIVTGGQLGGVTFDIGEGPLKTIACGTSDLTSTLPGPADPVTFVPAYGACVAEPGAMPVTITTNGCDYNVGVSKPGTTQEPASTGKMEAWLFCPAGQQIEIHIYENAAEHAANVSLCTYDIGPQGPVAAGVYHNVAGNPSDVVATLRPKFTAKRTVGPGFLCGGMNMLQHLPIQLTGNYTLRGFEELIGGGEGAPIPLHVG